MSIILFGRAAQFLLALAAMRVATTLLPPEEMGRMSLVVATTAFFALFLVNPVGMFINRRLHAWQSSRTLRHYLTRYWGYLILVAVLSAINLVFLQMAGMVGFGMTTGWLLLLVCGSLLFNTVNQTVIPSLNLLGYSGWFVWLTVATAAVSFVCATLLSWLIRPTAEYWLLGLLLGQTILAVIGAKVFFSHVSTGGGAPSPKIQAKHLRALFGFAWPVAIAVGFGWVQSQGYRYLVEGSLGLAPLGLFVAGYGISAGMIAGFESVLTTYFQPRLYRNVSTDDPTMRTQSWREYAAAITPSLLLTSAFIMMLAPEMTRILLGSDFQSAADYVIWGALAETARMLTSTYSLVAHVHMRTRWLILPNMIGAILSVTLCAALIPVFGAAGAGMGLMLSGLAVVIAMRIMLGERASGGIPIRATLASTALAGGLWVITSGVRHVLNSAEWWNVTGTVALIGILYLGLQYLLLREHLKDKREA